MPQADFHLNRPFAADLLAHASYITATRLDCDRLLAFLNSELCPMSGTTVSSADLDPYRRKLLFRAWHRGMREMDLIMGRFADAELGTMADADLAIFEILIEVPDRDLLSWITNEHETPSNYDTDVFRRLKAFHQHGAPIHV